MDNLSMISMFLLGLLGSGHCAGMCGPIVLAVPAKVGGLTSNLLYNLGRVTTYVALAAMLAAMRHFFVFITGQAISLDSVLYAQIWFSVIAAVFLLLFGAIRLGLLSDPAWLNISNPQRLPGFRSVGRQAMQSKQVWSLYIFGVFMGFLPCGLSYAALARSLAAENVWSALTMVFVFGLGTMPVLLLLGTALSSVMKKYSRVSDIIAALIMIAMGLSLLMDAMQAMLGR